MTEPGRPERPTMAQYRAVAQPPEVRQRGSSEHWLGDLYQRAISPYLSLPLVRMGFSANAVTGLMIVVGASAGAALLVPGIWGVVLAALLTQLQMLIDAADGEVARWRQTFSPAGLFLDKVGHYLAESFIPLGLGIRAAGGLGGMSDHYGWTTLGCVMALAVVLNKALNDMVHVARAHSGLARVAEDGSDSVPRPGLVAALRRAARYLPLHRIYHSVEMSLVILAATLLAYAVGADAASVTAAQWLVRIITPLAVLTVAGHFLAIMASSRLRAAR